MNIADDVGIFKFDILGQRGLAKIKDALAIIKKNNPSHPPIDITDIEKFKKDKNFKKWWRNRCLLCRISSNAWFNAKIANTRLLWVSSCELYY